MRLFRGIAVFLSLFLLLGCALGKKEWPEAVKKEDRFTLRLLEGSRTGTCLKLVLEVEGAAHRLESVLVQYEMVGDGPGEGCIGCPFIPRDAVLIRRGDDGFRLSGDELILSLCPFEEDREYRFRVAGVNTLSSLPSATTEVYVADPSSQ
ncbi:hypothetical protein [Salidesulfovibrio brasiliensis]|uniref:hypothetical protein n=1 Tax=Salidesulfovibrio brasiliensis TaxID=221711 RepID=UPI0006D06F9E|nr:hypothetical protein [Salidesulfovibrio brasiliensis]